MKTRHLLPAVLLALIALSVALAARSSPDDFVIENADASRTLTLGGSSALNGLIAAVLPRVMVEFADDSVGRTLAAPPGALLGLADQLPARFVMEFADRGKSLSLSYPKALIGDGAPPLVVSQTVLSGGGGVTFQWMTDEPAVGKVIYGFAPGQLVNQQAGTQFGRQHSLTVGGLGEGQTIYYRLVSTDRSGNVGQTAEQRYVVAMTIRLYLPSVIR